MDTARDILESYAGGEAVLGTELRAAVAWMLAAWDAVMEAAGEACRLPDGKKREAAFEGLLHAMAAWSAEIEDIELDLAATCMLPELVARHRPDHAIGRTAARRIAISGLIKTRLLGVRPEDQDLVLEDQDWAEIVAALEGAV